MYSGSIRAVVSSTASGDTGEVGKAAAPGTAVGGANRAKPTGWSSTVTIWPGRAPGQHDPGEPDLLLELGLAQRGRRGRTAVGVQFPGDAGRGSAPGASRWSSSTVAPALASHRSLLTVLQCPPACPARSLDRVRPAPRALTDPDVTRIGRSGGSVRSVRRCSVRPPRGSGRRPASEAIGQLG